MIHIFPDRDQSFGMSIPMPSSFNALPPPRFPSATDVNRVAAVQQSLVEQAGFGPGVYSSVNEVVLRQATTVYNGLIGVLTTEIAGLDVRNLCVSLYRRSEEYLGYINAFKYSSIPDFLEVGSTAATEARHYMWSRMSHYTIPIRWLIEICVKHCQFNGSEESQSQIDFLIELARRILEWDSIWEYLYSGILHYEVSIGPDYSSSYRLTEQAVAANNEHWQATVPWRLDEDRNWTNKVLRARTEIADFNVEESLANFVRDPGWGPLSKAMESELGYSATDWLCFSSGLMDLLDYDEYIKVTPKGELSEFMSRKRGLSPERFDLLLNDFALSKQLVSSYSLDQLRPSQHASRDTRLIRRPVVLLESPRSPQICVYGVETLEEFGRLFLYRFPSGRLQLPRMSSSGYVRSAIGGIQSELGNAFRDEIADLCKRAKFTVATEKDRVKSERIPQGAGFGPVDVFVVDRRFKRFVLAEAKDAAQPIEVPAEMKKELADFRKSIERMKKQADWFRIRVDTLKSEFGIASEEDYTVEGVIIVNYPRLWMYTQQDPLPVVADKHFYEMLQKGDRFLTTPVKV